MPATTGLCEQGVELHDRVAIKETSYSFICRISRPVVLSVAVTYSKFFSTNSADVNLIMYILIISESRAGHFIQIVSLIDSLHEMSWPVFLGFFFLFFSVVNTTIFQNVVCWNFTQHIER